MDTGEKDLISVIVPVYNVEKYIVYCLDSICNQTYCNLEIILIDDASNDNCGKLCDEYAQNDARIKCIHHKKNMGLSMARNHGIEKANGKYVVFVDGDDEIEYNMIEVLHETICKYSVPVVRCGTGRVYKLGGLKPGGIEKKNIIFEVLDGWRYLLKYDRCSACCGMYEINLAKKMKFPKGLLFEDFFLIPRLLCKIGEIVYIGNAKFYHYYKRRGSITEDFCQKGLSPDFSYIILKNLEYFKKRYGEKSFIFLIMEEFIFLRFVNEFLSTKNYDGRFVKKYRKCVMNNLSSILKNEYLGCKLKMALFYIFISPKLARTGLNYELIKNQQKNIIKEKVR